MELPDKPPPTPVLRGNSSSRLPLSTGLRDEKRFQRASYLRDGAANSDKSRRVPSPPSPVSHRHTFEFTFWSHELDARSVLGTHSRGRVVAIITLLIAHTPT